MASDLDLKSVSSLLTVDILKKVVKDIYVKKQGGKNIPDIVSYKVNLAASKGDGYMGIVYRINVVLSNDSNFNIIGKGMPSNLVRRKTYDCPSFFEQEVLFFNEVVPIFRDFERQQLGKKDNLTSSLLSVPECYHAVADGKNDYLLLEDLCESGYGMFDRTSELTPEQTTGILKNLARLHALSFAVKAKNPDKLKSITSKMKQIFFAKENEKRLSTYMHTLAEIIHRAVKDELKDTKYLAKFEKFIESKETLYKNLLKLVEVKEPAVVTHGDCWSTNFMQKVSDGKLQVQTIDFQMIRYGSPILDVSVFIFSCTTLEQRNEMGGVEKMLQIYHEELSSAVSTLGAPNSCITLQELRNHWREVGAIGLGYAIELVLLSIVEPSDVMDLDQWEGEEAIPLEDITHFNDVKDASGKKRLADLIRLTVDEGML